jgi:hypothetical protein
LIKPFKLRKACGIDSFPNECLRYLLSRPLVRLTNLSQFSIAFEGSKRHVEENNLLNERHFAFRARYSTALQCMRLTDHMTLNFNNSVSTVAVFMDIEKAFDTSWHPGLLCELFKLHFSPSLIKLISSFLSNRKFRVMAEGQLTTPRDI